MGALTHVQTPVPAGRFGPYAPLRVPGTKSRRANGLAAHRSPLDGLTAHFPVTRRVAGDESFDAMARRFIAAERSRPATRFPNWDAFPSFLRGQGKAASIEYAADIADLEVARGKAKYAADARPIGAQAFPSLAAELRLVLHPSIFLVASRFPIVTIWETNQSEHQDGPGGPMERRARPGGTAVPRGRSPPPSARRSDGKMPDQAVEQPAIGRQTVRAPAFRAGSPQRRVRSEAGSRYGHLDIREGAHGSILG